MKILDNDNKKWGYIYSIEKLLEVLDKDISNEKISISNSANEAIALYDYFNDTSSGINVTKLISRCKKLSSVQEVEFKPGYFLLCKRAAGGSGTGGLVYGHLRSV